MFETFSTVDSYNRIKGEIVVHLDRIVGFKHVPANDESYQKVYLIVDGIEEPVLLMTTAPRSSSRPSRGPSAASSSARRTSPATRSLSRTPTR